MKRPPRRHRPEAAIHAAVVGHLRLRGAPGLLFLHPANGASRDIREAVVPQTHGRVARRLRFDPLASRQLL
jgi:hypothetical protein